jgi:hypothetical protein
VTFATSINFHCGKCGHAGKLEAETTTDHQPVPSKYATAFRTDVYSLNLRLVLAFQRMGCGQAAAGVLGGMLSIQPNAFHSHWTTIEESIGRIQIALGQEILNENIAGEKLMSKQDEYGRYLFCVSIDAAWNTRGSGRSYNSDSGHHLVVGNETGRVVAVHQMSKRCAKCEIGEKNGVENPHDDALCSRNYDGSSKGMEPHGALVNLLDMFNNHNVVWEIMVMDDDSSTQNLLTWNHEDAFAAKLISEIPLTNGGNKKSDKGKLPLRHPRITRVADHNHRNRVMSGKCFNYAYAAKKISEMTLADAERLKRNMTYAMHEYKEYDFETFKKALWAVFYHHFNMHDTCGDWCPALQHKDNPEELKKLHYRCKLKNAELFDQIHAIWETYCTDKALREVHHKWHTNKCESMNQFITKFIRKSIHLCKTIVARARTYLAVSLDSIGYDEYYRTLFPLLNIPYDDNVMMTHHERLDKLKIRKAAYRKLPEVRRRNAAARAIKIRENIRKVLEDKKAGKEYGSGIADPSQKTKSERKDNSQCKHCGKMGHSRRSHRDCTLTTFSVKKKQGEFRLENVVVPMCSFLATIFPGTKVAYVSTYRES